jgi:hypothetical protein
MLKVGEKWKMENSLKDSNNYAATHSENTHKPSEN